MAPLATALPVLYTFTHAPSYSSQLSSSPSVDVSSPTRNQENDPPSSLAKPKKRVNFSLSPVTMDASSPKTPKNAAPVHRKSILKSRPSLSNSSLATSSPAVSFGLESYPSFTAMLETMCAALEANDNHTKLDVYLNLNNALRGLKAYPDSGFLLSKVTALVTYIRRDIEFPSDSLEGCESRVMIQALKFFSFLVSLDQVVHLIDTQTVSWILNLSISAIENPDIKKNMLLCHLSFLASQRLTRLFNNEHSNRVFDVLMRVHSRSRSIEGQCYQNFSTLITMTPAVMLQRASEWVPLVLRASFSESSAMQSKAVLPLRIASRIFLGVKEFSRTVLDAFNMPKGSDKSPEACGEGTKTLFDECYDNIEVLLNNKHEEHILSVWEAIIVLLIAWGRRRDERLDKWTHLNKWLDVFRKCVNSTDVAVRARAICAWQKLAYAWLTTPIIGADSDISKRRTGILLTVFKFLQDNKPETISALTVTFSKMTCLIMRPGVSTSQISAAEFTMRQCDFTWNQLVIPVIRDSCLHNPSTFAFGATLLHALLAASSKATPTRTEPELCFGTVSLSDIPKLNAKWTRAKTELVLETIAKVFDKASTTPDRELAMQVWSAFLKNIQSITKREVRQSAESMESIASICNYVQSYVRKSDMQPETFKLLMLSTMETFGMITLAEKPFASDEYGKFIPTGSPSSRAILDNTGTGSSLNVHSPLVRLWRVYLTSVPVSESNMPEYISAMKAIVESALTALSSRRKSISFLAMSLQATTLAGDPGVTAIAGKRFLDGSDKKARCWAVLAKYIVDLLYAETDDSSQSSVVDEGDMEMELKIATLLSAHRYAHDSDIASLAVSIFKNAENGIDFIESFMRYMQDDMTTRGTTELYATLTAMIGQLQALVIKYYWNDSNERDLMEQSTRLFGDVMQIAFKEVRQLTWGNKSAVDESFYISIISTLQSVDDASFKSMTKSYYIEICCGPETHSPMEKIMESNKPLFEFHISVCKAITGRAQSSTAILLSPEIMPIIVFYLNSNMPVFADASLAACTNVLQPDQMGPDTLQLRLAIRTAKNSLTDAKRKQIVDESIANINEKAQQEMQSIAERRSQSASPIKESSAPTSKLQETTAADGRSPTSLALGGSQSVAIIADPESHALPNFAAHKSVNANAEVHPMEIDNQSITVRAQTSFLKSRLPAGIADAMEPKVFSQEATRHSRHAIPSRSSEQPILEDTCHSISLPLEFSNEATTSGATPMPDLAVCTTDINAEKPVTPESTVQQSVAPQSSSQVDLDQHGDSIEIFRTASNEVCIGDKEEVETNVSRDVRVSGNEEADIEAEDANGSDFKEVVPVESTIRQHNPKTADEESRIAPVTERIIVSQAFVQSMPSDALADTQPIFESQGSSGLHNSTSDGKHVEYSRELEDGVIPASRSATQNNGGYAHQPCNDGNFVGLTEPVPSQGPTSTEKGCVEGTSAAEAVLSVADSQDEVTPQPAFRSPHEGAKITRRRVRKRSSAPSDASAVSTPAESAVSVHSSSFAIIPPVSYPAPLLAAVHVDQSIDHTIISGEKKCKKRGRKSKQQKSAGDFENISGNTYVRQGSINDCIIVSTNPNAGVITPSPAIMIKRECFSMEDDEMADLILARRKRGHSKFVSESSESGDSSPVEPNETPTKKARVSKSSSLSSRMRLSSTKPSETSKNPILSSSIVTGVDDDEEDEIQSSPFRGSLERYSDTLQNSNASRSSSSSSQRRSSRATLSKPSDGREMVPQAQQFQDPPSNLPIQQVNPKRAVQQGSIETSGGLVSARSLALSSTTGEQSTVVEKSAHTSIHSVPDFLGQLRHLEAITSDLLSQMSGKQKRELDAMLLRMLWKTHVAAEPLVPVLTGHN